MMSKAVKMKSLILFGAGFLFVDTIFCLSIDPLSKITIKSSRATCGKNKTDSKDIVLTYLDDVHVEFADHSTVTSQELEVICNLNKSPSKTLPEKSGNKSSDQKSKALSQFKKITFSKHVVINKDEFKATADYADILVDQRLCSLRGNVQIEHKKKSPKDVPVQVKSDAATIRLDSQQILLAGSSKSPVSTVIDLQDHPIIRNKTDKKQRQQQPKKGAVKQS
ncbi:hypothetical protein JST56_04785 [Candidatus Dependentiae bacterium]|nr:hypothetical protein [Candidatus Dependentiae bacterium]